MKRGKVVGKHFGQQQALKEFPMICKKSFLATLFLQALKEFSNDLQTELFSDFHSSGVAMGTSSLVTTNNLSGMTHLRWRRGVFLLSQHPLLEKKISWVKRAPTGGFKGPDGLLWLCRLGRISTLLCCCPQPGGKINSQQILFLFGTGAK